MHFDLAEILFYGIPILSVLFFAFTLLRYLRARRLVRRTPDALSADALRARRNLFLIAAGIFGVLVAVVVAFTLLLMMAVAYM